MDVFKDVHGFKRNNIYLNLIYCDYVPLSTLTNVKIGLKVNIK